MSDQKITQSDDSQSGGGTKHKYTVDKETCIGCGICVTIAPDGYEMNAEGKSEVIKKEAIEDKAMEEGKEACPVGAIRHEGEE